MLPLKWRLYKIFNYILLVIGLLFFSYLCYLLIFEPPPRDSMLIPVLIVSLFLVMVIHSIINVVFSIKYFPDKALIGSSRIWNFISIVSNILSVGGLIIFIIAGAVAEFEESSYDVVERDQTGKLILLFLLLLLVSDVFILICQFRVASFLRHNSSESFTSMIDSIGKE